MCASKVTKFSLIKETSRPVLTGADEPSVTKYRWDRERKSQLVEDD